LLLGAVLGGPESGSVISVAALGIKRDAELMPDGTDGTHGTYVPRLRAGVAPERGNPEESVG